MWLKWNGKGRTVAIDYFKWDFTLISEILQNVSDLFSLAILRALIYQYLLPIFSHPED